MSPVGGGVSGRPSPGVAVVDYGLGNLFSVRQACHHVGVEAQIVSSADELARADAVILPGVGAFGDAMAELRRRDLVAALLDVGLSEKPLVGICLGMQLLMTESFEFGRHRGLGLIEGEVVRFETRKVPHVGWNGIFPARTEAWTRSVLCGLRNGEPMYFIHSFHVKPEDAKVVLSTSEYGGADFCSSLQRRNVFGCQFHPERSGPAGLQIYANLAARLRGEVDGRSASHA